MCLLTTTEGKHKDNRCGHLSTTDKAGARKRKEDGDQGHLCVSERPEVVRVRNKNQLCALPKASFVYLLDLQFSFLGRPPCPLQVQLSATWMHTAHTVERHQTRQQGEAPVETRASGCIHRRALSSALVHLGYMTFPSASISPFISHISCSCLSLTVPSSRFPHQIFCSRTTAAPFLQSFPLIHTTDILAHRLVSRLSLSLSSCTKNSQSLGRVSVKCQSIFHRPWSPLLNMLFTVLTDRQADSVVSKARWQAVQ